MPPLRDFQSSFGAAVRGASVSGLGLVRENGIPLEKRMDVYRNNVHASLIDALESAYPVVLRLVGREFFRAMSREYLRAHMPKRGTLIGFGGMLPEFLEGFGPVSSLPYLCDVARIERAWLTAYHSADCPAVRLDALSKVSPEELADLRFDLHASVQFVTSRFPAWSIWRTNREDAQPAAIDLDAGGETACLLRGPSGVAVYLVDENTKKFADALLAGEPLGVAAEAALETDGDFDLSAMLQLFLSGGAFVRVIRPEPTGTKP